MSKKAIAAIVAAALAVGGGVAVVASSGGDDSNAEVHQLENGGTHTGPMPAESDEMGGETMDGQDMMGEGE